MLYGGNGNNGGSGGDDDHPQNNRPLGHNLPPNLYATAVSYNVLRIMSGMAGLRYSSDDDDDFVEPPPPPPSIWSRWTPYYHVIFPLKTQKEIWLWLLVEKRLDFNFPRELRQLVSSWIATLPH